MGGSRRDNLDTQRIRIFIKRVEEYVGAFFGVFVHCQKAETGLSQGLFLFEFTMREQQLVVTFVLLFFLLFLKKGSRKSKVVVKSRE